MNLKELNKNVEYFHFKVETLKNASALVKPIVLVFLFVCLFSFFFFFCSLDLTDAYFSVHVNNSSLKYLQFFW